MPPKKLMSQMSDSEILRELLGHSRVCDILNLEELRQVELKLTAAQWEYYIDCFATPVERLKRHFCWDRISAILNLDAEQKSAALANTIRYAPTA